MKQSKYKLLFTLPCIIFSLVSIAASVDTIDIYSAAMRKTLKAAVTLPANYKKSDRPFPVLYLLHGGQGSFRDWLTQTTDKTLLHKLADQYNIIIVNPEGGLISYYFDSHIDKGSRYETFISEEVIEKIDATYPTIKDRKGRVIAGLSMGGHGAMFIAGRHPELFCAAGSMSGVMNINTATWKVPADFAKLRSDNFARLLGPAKDTLNPYPENTIVGMVDKLKANDVKLIFDIGVDDFLIETNRELHRRLLANGTPHDYIERPGKHEWSYWTNALPYQLVFFQKILQLNGSLPTQ